MTTRRAMRVLVDVDVQNDFCLPSGALSVPGSPNDLFRRLVRFAVEKSIPIVGSVDSHAFDAWEFASSGNVGPNDEAPRFPDHCIKGTAGWLKVEGTLPPRFRFVPNQLFSSEQSGLASAIANELVEKRCGGVYFEKEVYSLFANPNAEAFLREIDPLGEVEFFVFGVATDYCVRAAALGLRARGHRAALLEDAVRGITATATGAALREMREHGVRLTTTDEIFEA